jgi:hypothetical protein
MATRAGARERARAAVVVGAVALAFASATGIAVAKSATTTTPLRPSGPTAELAPLSGGNGIFLGERTKPDLAKVGYVEREYSAEGTASAYQATGTLGGDGKWTFAPASTAPYKTRVLVSCRRRPPTSAAT